MHTQPVRLFRHAVVAVVFGLAVRADVRLPAIFSDHLVLQRDVPVPVWGLAEPGEKVTVTFAGQTRTVEASPEGKWMVRLGALSGTETGVLKVAGRNTIEIQDVLVGEVWLGSGQSNMAMTVNRAKDFEQEKAAAVLPRLRMFKEESGAADTAQVIGKGRWVTCSPESVGTFSATLYFFGRELNRTLGAPVGLINSSVGGTPIESWIAPEVQRAAPALREFFVATEKGGSPEAQAAAKQKYEADLAKWQADAKAARAQKAKAPKRPTDPSAVVARKGNIGGLFQGKIAPLIPYALRGALWYQGEANTVPPKAAFYEAQLRLLVTDWRARWGYDFPFAWAQLPNFGGPGRDWPTVREAMRKTLELPRTGMGINIDIGEEKDIHPGNKQEVGRRLSLWALGTVYGRAVPATSGPLPLSQEVKGSEVAVRFAHANGGLVAKGGPLQGFIIAGEDRRWKPAQARMAGDEVFLSHPEVPKPVAVRYAWENFPACNLYNGAGLPASPFRTDAWAAAPASP